MGRKAAREQSELGPEGQQGGGVTRSEAERDPGDRRVPEHK